MVVCKSCGRNWGGLAECHCGACHSHFTSITAFDMHRVKDTCVPPQTRRVGLFAYQRKDGIAWGLPLQADK